MDWIRAFAGPSFISENRNRYLIQVVLASESPRRSQIMKAIGVLCRLAPQKIDESLRHGESAKDYVERLSREKRKVLWGNFVNL